MKLFCSVILCTVIASSWGQDQATLVLSKEEAMTRALERNFGIQIERVQVEIAEEGIEIEKGIFDPEISASFTTASSDGQDTDSVSAGVDGLVSTGGTYSLTVRSDESLINDGRFNAFAGLAFRQPLLRNFGFTRNLAALRIARYQFDSSEWEFKQLLLDTIASTVFAFNDLYQAQQLLESSVRIRDLANQTLLDEQRRLELGAIASLDIVQSQASLASNEDRVLSASIAVIRAQNRFKQLIFDNAEEALANNLEIEVYTEPEVSDEYKLYVSSLLENSPSYHIGEIALEIARLRLMRDRNQTLPSLDLIARYGFSGVGGSLGGSVESAFSNDNDTFTLGASFSFPVLNRSARARESISRLRERIAEVDLESIKQAIQLEFYASFQTMTTNFQRIDAARLARELAGKSLEAEEKKVNAGTGSTFRVLSFQNSLANAELREITAIANYNRSVADFNRLRGVLE